MSYGDRIILDIGGTKFKTTDVTLENSDFFKMLYVKDSRFERENDGSFFIDRDPTHFRHILNYLRDERMVPQLDPSNRIELLAEARFYGVQGLVRELVREAEAEAKAKLESQALPLVARGRSIKATKRRRRR